MKLRSLFTYIALFVAGLTLTVSCTNPAANIKTDADTTSSSGGGGATIASLGFSA